MTSDTDLPLQPYTLQQHPPLMKKKSNPIWKVVFITLLIVNVLFVSWANSQLSPGPGGANLSFIVVFPLALLLAIIDLIAVLSYVFTHRPLSKVVNIISTSISFALSFLLITVAWAVVSGGLGINPNRDTRLEYVMIATVTALFSLLFFRYMSYK